MSRFVDETPMFTPVGAVQPEATAAEARRFGRAGRPPWSLRQTVTGATLTLAPWLTLLIGVQVVAGSGAGAASTKPLPVLYDVVGAVIALLYSVIGEGVFTLAPLYYAVWRRTGGTTWREGLRALGLRATRLRPAVAWVVGALLVTIAVELLYSWLVGVTGLPLQTNTDRLVAQAKIAPLTIGVTLVAAVFIAPFCEELFFRGYLFSGLLQGMRPWQATLLSAALFTLAHGDIGSALPLFVIGVALAVIRWRTGSLWPGIALHMANNTLAALSLLVMLHK